MEVHNTPSNLRNTFEELGFMLHGSKFMVHGLGLRVQGEKKSDHE